ncbi:TIGR03085 family metal-binding protein [Tomitella fengzijianii]|uniref:TIGR03085 family protein n=1 Tax=Tomitella fengzijianii TaxID=2597660 RepID=A0A516X128_9ACTN|nr:TIGR03085 family metal-binding protein [Tomitella fengzijianii]QDQ96786.1 TIGR03085 family protein [Tomitella fengzijianii]
MGFVREERRSIVDTMQQAGPDAPTLCEGWTVRDLLAHLVLREGRPDAAPGILIPPLAGYTARVQASVARRNFGELLDAVRSGPPWYSPMRYLDEKANLVEYIVHHEDVRRAQPDWEPRELPAPVRGALWKAATMLGRRAYSSAAAPVVLEAPGRPEVRVHHGGDGGAVTLRGEPEELVLHAFGRDAVRIGFEGPAEQARAVREMKRTIP